jgi:hypothetical protein
MRESVLMVELEGEGLYRPYPVSYAAVVTHIMCGC